MVAAASDKLVVALNALINPDAAGGSESSALSILMNYRDGQSPDVDMVVTALPQYAERMVALRGDPSKVIVWPWKEFATVSSEPTAAWGKRLRARLPEGPLRARFDDVSRALNRRAFLRSQPSKADVDNLLDRSGVDVAHFTYPVKWPTRRPYIFEPHDVQQFHFPEFFTPDTLAWRAESYGDGVRNAAFVVCGTWWTKRDIMRWFNVPARQIAVIPRSSTMGRSKITVDQAKALTVEAGLPDGFMYYAAMTFPHKNHLRLFEAMALLRDRDGLKVNLVLTGRPYKPFHPTLVEAITRLKLKPQIKFLGKVSEDLLAACYMRAKFIVFPSLLEGHSQSLLEALYHRKPIVAAKQSSVPETVGSAALLFDALEVEEMAEAIKRAWTDKALRGQLALNGAGVFERYDWNRARTTLTACYKAAAGRSLSDTEQAALDVALTEYKPEGA